MRKQFKSVPHKAAEWVIFFMRKTIALLLTAVLALSLCACGGPSSAQAGGSSAPAAQSGGADSSASDYEITDLLGRSVRIPAETSGYACIGPGALRLYCYIADDAQLVGVEEIERSGQDGRPYAMSIPDAAQQPLIGPGGPANAPDAELLFAAGPDVIFTCYTADVSAVDELQAKTGIPVVALSYGAGRLFDQSVYDSLSLIGRITGNETRAAVVVDYFEEIKNDLTARTAGVAEKPSVYLGCQSSRGSHGIESTTGDYAIFDTLNAVNVVKEAGISGYAMLDKEKLLEMDPEVIVIDAGGLSLLQEDYDADPEFYKALSAFKDGRVYLQMPFNYYTTNLEIALADAYYIGSVLYPEQFADVDPAEKFDELSAFFLGIDCYERIAAQYYGGFQRVVLGG